ncbi:MAG TPA: hypothetical protein VGF55_12395 [Gemmataceae bacterium]|jgi:hypothetical protein
MRLALLVSVAIATALPAAPPVSLLSGSAKDELAGDLRGLLLQHLPQPLYEKENNWGHQEMVKRRHIRGRLRDIDIEVTHDPRNDGVWKRVRVDAVNPTETLVFDLRNVATPEPGKLTFQVFAALDTHVTYTHQRWESGLKLFDATARAKARVKVTLDCEAVCRVENGVLLPDLVIELKVAKADVRYDNLKFDHIAGLGGEAAQIIGELAHAALNQWRPSVEKDALAKANAAIVKAGQHKEVRLSLSKLFRATAPAAK